MRSTHCVFLNLDDIKEEIVSHFAEFKDGEAPDFKILPGFGHSVGDQIEGWVLHQLRGTRWEVEVLRIGDFLTLALRELYPEQGGKTSSKSVGELTEEAYGQIQQIAWWGSLLSTKSAIQEYFKTGAAGEWQQAGADLVLIDGGPIFDSDSDVFLLNVKSHDVSRSSRPPNIMSALRLLRFLARLLESENAESWLEQANLLFLAIDYDGQTSRYSETHLKDLFRLDVPRIPQINFDAAIQIQWQVGDMKEIEQSKAEFIDRLLSRFLREWDRHREQKTRSFEELAARIVAKLEPP